MIFCNDGDEEIYISSADLMTRNLDHRIEVTCPVFDENIKKHLKKVFEIQWKDNTKARILDPALSNKFVTNDKKKINSQTEIYNILKEE